MDLQMKEMKVTLKLTHQPVWRFRCPECDEEYPTPDHRQRKWRDLNNFGCLTMIEAGVSRVDCPNHGFAKPTSRGQNQADSSPPCLRR